MDDTFFIPPPPIRGNLNEYKYDMMHPPHTSNRGDIHDSRAIPTTTAVSPIVVLDEIERLRAYFASKIEVREIQNTVNFSKNTLFVWLDVEATKYI